MNTVERTATDLRRLFHLQNGPSGRRSRTYSQTKFSESSFAGVEQWPAWIEWRGGESSWDLQKERFTKGWVVVIEFWCSDAKDLTKHTRLSVVVRFKGVGNAPIMKQNVYKIIATNRFQAVIQFLRKELGWQKGEPLVRRSPSSPLYYFGWWIALVLVYQLHLLSCSRWYRVEPL